MTKKQKGNKQQTKSGEKSLAEQKKEILAKNYGSKQSKEVKNLLKKMEIQEKLKRKEIEERRKKEEEVQLRVVENKPKKQTITIEKEDIPIPPSNMVCRFLIDALQNKTFNKDWTCPLNCKDIHEFDSSNLEEFLEMKRTSAATDKLLTKEEYDTFIIRLEGEKKKFKAALTGYDLYKKGLLKDIEDIDAFSHQSDEK